MDTNFLLRLMKIIDKIEYYFIPICFSFGFTGNLIGSLCLFRTHELRKRTPLFILGSIGLSDSIFLLSQLQRWYALSIDSQLYIVNNASCKFYLMLLRFSLLLSSSLLLALIIIRTIRFYIGRYCLSTYSNIGQMFSKLCVAYIFALSISLSWHELWSSGIKNGTQPVYNNEDSLTLDDVSTPVSESKLVTSTTTKTKISVKYETFKNLNFNNKKVLTEDLTGLKCSKNVDSVQIIDSLNTLHFLICFFIYLFLLINSILVFKKIKKLELFKCNRTDDKKTEINITNKDSSNNQNVFVENLVKSVSRPLDNICNDINEIKNINSSVKPNDVIKEVHIDLLKQSREMKSRFSLPDFKIFQKKSYSFNCQRSISSNIGAIANINNLTKEPQLIQLLSINNQKNDYLNETNNKSPKKRELTWFILCISLFTTFFCLPFIFIDYFSVNDVQVYHLMDERLNSTLYSQKEFYENNKNIFFFNILSRLTLIFINLPHSIKFYILILFYKKFRHELCLFFHVRFYFNKEIALVVFKKRQKSPSNSPKINLVIRSEKGSNFYDSSELASSFKILKQKKMTQNNRKTGSDLIINVLFNCLCCVDNGSCFRLSKNDKNSKSTFLLNKFFSEKNLDKKNDSHNTNQIVLNKEIIDEDKSIGMIQTNYKDLNKTVKKFYKNKTNNDKKKVIKMLAKFGDDEESSSIFGFKTSNP